MLDSIQWQVRNLAGWSAWRRAATLEEMGALVVRWLEGRDRVLPWHVGPPDPETAEIRGQLRVLNQRALVTTDSQPGLVNVRGMQRAWVRLLAYPDAARHLVMSAEGAGLIAICAGVRQLPTDPVPITIASSGRVITSDRGAPEKLFLKGQSKVVASRAWSVTIIDPEWGRKSLLWEVTARSGAGHTREG